MIAFFNAKLKVLVFGPNPSISHPPGLTTDLAKKRKDIKDALNVDGHTAVFPEDLMRGSFDPSIGNLYVWEQLLVQEYDMVINLVGSFGAVDELSLLKNPGLALKAVLFFYNGHTDGLPYEHAKAIECMGAKLHTFDYPSDLVNCSLLKQVQDKVKAIRILKYLAS